MSKELTKKNILDAFWSLYQIRDISKISVKEICEIAGYHRTTFYAHFTDVYDVLEQLELSLLPPFTLLFEELNKSHKSLDFELLTDMFLNILTRNRDYLSVIVGKRRDPYLQDRIKKVIRPIILEYIKAKGLSDSYTVYFVEYQMSALFGVITLWFQRGEDLSKEELIKLLYSISNNGIYNMIEPL